MKVKVVVHEAEEGGYWADVPAIPGCATQGETFQELLKNLYEAVEGCLSVDVARAKEAENDQIVEIVLQAPKADDERTREILRELAQLNPEDPRAGIWSKV